MAPKKQTAANKKAAVVEKDKEDEENEQIVKQQAIHFFSKDVVMPQEIYCLTMSFLSAFPYYFQLRRVSKGWKAFMEEKLYDFVQDLNLLPHKGISKTLADKVMDRAVIEFLPQALPNVKRLFVPLRLWKLVKPSTANKNIEKWIDLDLHIFPCDQDNNETIDVESLPCVKSIIVHAMRYSSGPTLGETSSKITFNFPFVDSDEDDTLEELENKDVAMEHFTDLRIEEQFVAFCKHIIGMFIFCEFDMFVEVYNLDAQTVFQTSKWNCIICAAFSLIDNQDLWKYLCNHQTIRTKDYAMYLRDEMPSLAKIKRQIPCLANHMGLINEKSSLILTSVAMLPEYYNITKYLIEECNLQIPEDCTTWLYYAVDGNCNDLVMYMLEKNVTFDGTTILPELLQSELGKKLFQLLYNKIAHTLDNTALQTILRSVLLTPCGEAVEFIMSKISDPKSLLDKHKEYGISDEAGALDHFEILYKYIGDDLIAFRNDENTSILFAVETEPNAYRQIVSYFKDKLNDKNDQGFVPLLTYGAKTENLVSLIDAGADINIRDENGESILLRHEYEDDEEDEEEKLRLVKEYATKIDFTMKNAKGENIMHHAPASVLEYVPHLVSLLFEPDNQKECPIFRFAKKGQLETIFKYVPKLWTFSIGDDDLLTSFCKHSSYTAVIDAFRLCKSHQLKENQMSPLHWAFQNEVFADFDPNDLLDTPLAKSMMNHVALLKEKPVTPFMLALRHVRAHNALETLQAFFALGAKGIENWNIYCELIDHVNCFRIYDAYPLPKKDIVIALPFTSHWKKNYYHYSVLIFLAHVDKNQPTPTWMYEICRSNAIANSIKNGNIDVLQYVIDMFGMQHEDAVPWESHVDENLNTLLHLLVAHIPVQKTIVDLASHFPMLLNMQTKRGNSALHIAVIKGYASVVDKLISMGADKTIKNEKNQVALDLATNATIKKYLTREKRKFEYIDDDVDEESQTPEDDDDDTDFGKSKKRPKKQRRR